MLRSHNGLSWKDSLVDSIPERKLKGYMSLKERKKLGLIEMEKKQEQEGGVQEKEEIAEDEITDK